MSRRLGPHYVPTIACDKCGFEHHPDSVTTEYQPRCHGCSGYVRRPTEAEERQFNDFLVWNARHREREQGHA